MYRYDMARLSLKRVVVGFVAIGILLLVSVYFFNSSWKENLVRFKESRSYEVLPDPNPKEVKVVAETAEEKEEERKGFQNNGFNQFISDRLPLDRAVPDTRDTRCASKTYPSNMPDTSVIIIFHNEAYTVLLRTITSVLNRSPSNLLHEIILVDDFSDHEDLKDKLEKYIATQPKVKIVRHVKREGLIRARLSGAMKAAGKVLTFLDSHCEVNVQWLEPLLARIHLNRKTVVCPVIDVISLETLEYSHIRGPPGVRGGFNWGLQFKWKKIPNYEQKRRGYDETREVKSPTMAGGLFSMEKNYFFELGAYDLGMDIWGAENLEISFRIWMCGGELEIIPCSRVGHIFRKRQPYTFPGGVDEILTRNNMRLAEVWMDEYKEFYYNKRSGIKSRDYGNITDRVNLRKKLHCKSFSWYLGSVCPELPKPNENLHHGGAVRNVQTSTCLDSFGHREGGEIGVYACHGQAGNQDFGFTDLGEMQFDDDLCLDFASHKRGGPVTIYNCHGLGGNQKWEYTDKQQLYHSISRLCMEAQGQKVVMNVCTDSNAQKWTFSHHFTPNPNRIRE